MNIFHDIRLEGAMFSYVVPTFVISNPYCSMYFSALGESYSSCLKIFLTKDIVIGNTSLQVSSSKLGIHK